MCTGNLNKEDKMALYHSSKYSATTGFSLNLSKWPIFDIRISIFELIEIIKANILTKNQEDWIENMVCRALTKFTLDFT